MTRGLLDPRPNRATIADMKLARPLIFAVTLAYAESPPPPDSTVAQDALLEQARALPNGRDAREISNRLWELWAKAPNEAAQALLDRGMAARAVLNFVDAKESFDKLVSYCPDYAEGYNQRAFVSFLREDYAAALIDLDLALERSPKHLAAMSGKALTLMGLGRHDEAQAILREAVKLNPWIPEASLLQGEEL